MQQDIKEAVESSVITVKKVDTSSEEIEVIVNESSLVELNTLIDSLDEDQVIEEVKTYQSVLDIPQFNITAYISDGTSKKDLKRGVGRHKSTVDLGEIGNCVIAGHSSVTYDCIFNGVENIEVLDTFFVYDKEGVKHTYYVIEKRVVSPNDVSILYNTVDDISQVTLYTCSNKGSQRLVIIGQEFNEEQLKEFEESFRNRLYVAMDTLNNAHIVEPLSQMLAERGIIGYKHYDFKLCNLNPEYISCFITLYKTSLGDNVNYTSSAEDIVFSMPFGTLIREENSSYDISEN